MRKELQPKMYLVDYFISIVSHMILIISIALALVAVFDKNSKGEASIGTFDVMDFNDGWVLTTDGDVSEVTLPVKVKSYDEPLVSIQNTLPSDLSDNMSLMVRASMEDVYVYIDGQLREEYASDQLANGSYYIPSAYVVTKLNAEDSGKDIRVDIRFKTQGQINGITLGYGNDVWYSVVKGSIPVNLAAVVVLIFGVVLILAIAIIRGNMRKNLATRQLGFLMIDVALWVISESTIRQFVFARPTLTEIFAYLTVELMGALAGMYFDEVQHRKYHKIYVVLEAIVLAQLILNLILHATGILHLYQSLFISHAWTAIGIVIVVINIIRDCFDKEIKKYKITAIGMVCFLILSTGEMIGFYISRFHEFGTFICAGLILLMMFTIIQALFDEVENSIERENKQLQMVNNTIETIAGSIDAKDEYTGGHSERVGIYAERLAREIAADYGFSEEDILRIRYIGLVHDIGKIGVADTVLNKAGRLTDEEFSLMKKHTEIGYTIMGATGESMEGLLDGIRYHHERFDGKGYPKGLSDTEIPLVARILALADSYDAMTSNRVYRKRLTDEEVRKEFIKCAGSQFDPALTKALVRLIDNGELRVSTADGMSIDENGKILVSSKLENKLHNDLLQDKHIENPTHVRMMCYVIKLMEKKKKPVQVLFYGSKVFSGRTDQPTDEERNATWDKLNAVAKRYMTGQDIVIQYNDEYNALAFFGKDEEIKAFLADMKALDCPVSMLDVDGNEI